MRWATVGRMLGLAMVLALVGRGPAAAQMQVAVGDVTCDGRPDVVLGLFDAHHTPRFRLRVLSGNPVGGAALTLAYGDGEMDLCDASHPPEMRLFTMPDAEVPVFTPEAVCPRVIGVWDRQCIPLTVFWRRHPAPGQGRLLPAIN